MRACMSRITRITGTAAASAEVTRAFAPSRETVRPAFATPHQACKP